MPEADLGHIHSISDGGFCVSQAGLRKSPHRLILAFPSICTSNEGTRNRQGSVFFCAVLRCWQDLTYSSDGHAQATVGTRGWMRNASWQSAALLTWEGNRPSGVLSCWWAFAHLNFRKQFSESRKVNQLLLDAICMSLGTNNFAFTATLFFFQNHLRRVQ